VEHVPFQLQFSRHATFPTVVVHCGGNVHSYSVVLGTIIYAGSNILAFQQHVTISSEVQTLEQLMDLKFTSRLLEEIGGRRKKVKMEEVNLQQHFCQPCRTLTL
jgi:hypothetical protein